MQATIRVFAFVSLFGAALPAQSSLAAIEKDYAAKRDAAAAKNEGLLGYEDHKKLSAWFTQTLTGYLANKPDAADHTRARLTLVTVQRSIGAMEQAKKALGALRPDRASMLELLEAAELAGQLRLDQERGAWIDAALAKPGVPFVDRMQAGMLLMTRLVEVERADKLFQRALAEAKNDDDRALVLWYVAAAVREREDRAEGDYEKSLDDLAKRFPKTLYGGIARDRLRAMAYEIGDVAVEIAGTATDGKPLKLSDLRGKPVLVCFWASWDPASTKALGHVRSFAKKFGDRGLTVLGVSLDENRAELDAYLAANPNPWRDLYDGKGFESPHALRTNVEQVPNMILVDREGKIAALRLFIYDDSDVEHVAATLEKAIG